MIQKLFSVYDSASQLFGRPFASVSQGSALRAFTDECNRSDSDFYKHPDDYILYCLGTFDESSGVLVGGGPELVARGKDVMLVAQ